MDRIGGFRDLRVWQAAMGLVCDAYEVARALPTDERYELSSQVRRSAVSVASNIAEGWGRRTRPEFARFVRVANGSLRELQTQILLCRRLKLAPETVVDPALTSTEHVGRLLLALERSLHRPS